ncbi:MAG: 3-dehydroquinate synthase [Opitutae bacterium]
MKKLENELQVNLGDRSYPIRIGRDLGNDISGFISASLEKGKRGVVLMDDDFAKSQPEFSRKILSGIPHLIIPSGEQSKSVEQLTRSWNFLSTSQIDRSGFVFAVGGGVVGDLAGFVAASYLRGISFHQVPTTLLSMVDSSVGGKTGINLAAGKNLIGSFHQPDCVWADLNLLHTLPAREFSAGMAEVVKYGMLADRGLFEHLLRSKVTLSPSSTALPDLIHLCCSIKAKIVQGDEREKSGLKGGRALLNLGHTFGHAIEKVAGYGTYLHGEAVAIGLVCAFRLSQFLGKCKKYSVSDLLDLLESYNLPTSLNEPIKLADLNLAMHADKKVERGNLRFVVMEEVGNAHCIEGVQPDMVDRVWTSVGARA